MNLLHKFQVKWLLISVSGITERTVRGEVTTESTERQFCLPLPRHGQYKTNNNNHNTNNKQLLNLSELVVVSYDAIVNLSQAQN